jgi:hypothetical protein
LCITCVYFVKILVVLQGTQKNKENIKTYRSKLYPFYGTSEVVLAQVHGEGVDIFQAFRVRIILAGDAVGGGDHMQVRHQGTSANVFEVHILETGKDKVKVGRFNYRISIPAYTIDNNDDSQAFQKMKCH